MSTNTVNNNILVCPLNWGLGHATRAIPIIEAALEKGYNPIIASDGDALVLLKKQFPQLQYIELPALRIKYGKGLFAYFQFCLSIPFIINWILKDHKKIKEITQSIPLCLIISDNRWGIWHQHIKSVFITHQIMVKMPWMLKWMEYPVFRIQQWVLRHFNEIWTPDDAHLSHNLSGDLSHSFKPKVKHSFIGTLSQFHNLYRTNTSEYEIAVILSGPEPQRTYFETAILKQLSSLSFKTIIVGGKIADKRHEHFAHITYTSFANREELHRIIMSSNVIICRSGYTSIMDLIELQKPAILIPTPSQTEQVYLAQWLSAKNWFLTYKQKDINQISESAIMKAQSLRLPSTEILRFTNNIF